MQSVLIKPMADVASKCRFCLRFAHYVQSNHKQVLDAIVTLANSDIPYTCDVASAMVKNTCDDLLAMTSRNNRIGIGRAIKGWQVKYSACSNFCCKSLQVIRMSNCKSITSKLHAACVRSLRNVIM